MSAFTPEQQAEVARMIEQARSRDSVLIRQLQSTDPWTDVSSFSNSWVNFDSNRPARYYKKGERVYLDGMIKSGTINTTAFTLPADYRPSATRNLAVVSNSAFGAVYIDSSGNVVPYVGSNAWVDLSPISFRVA